MVVLILYYPFSFQALQYRFSFCGKVIDCLGKLMRRLRDTAKRKLRYYHFAYIPTLSPTNFTRLHSGFFRTKSQPKNLHRFPEAFLPRFDEHSLSHFFFARCDCSCSIGL